MSFDPDKDKCSCQKDRGMWGAYGLHWFTWDSAYTERRILDRAPGATDAQLRVHLEHGTAPDKQQAAIGLLAYREALRAFYRGYEGTELAFARCPLYVAAIERNRAAA